MQSRNGGPSPHVWGLHQALNELPSHMRAIPTCVGTTPAGPGVCPERPGHPHVCGDYATGAAMRFEDAGPSPRVWGLRRRGGLSAQDRAGHPHVCGDYGFRRRLRRKPPGPSPRVWGLRHLHPKGRGGRGPSPRVWGLQGAPNAAVVRRRAIPTCVGTTTTACVGTRRAAGHPHVRGDYRLPHRVDPHPRRAIPTCVGTTETPLRVGRPLTGHPHVRGDYT